MADSNSSRARKPALEVYLEPEFHERISRVCQELGQTKTTFGRDAILRWLRQVEKDLGIEVKVASKKR